MDFIHKGPMYALSRPVRWYVIEYTRTTLRGVHELWFDNLADRMYWHILSKAFGLTLII